MDFIMKDDKNKETAEERAVRRFGSVEELEKLIAKKIPGLRADVLLLLYEIIIRLENE